MICSYYLLNYVEYSEQQCEQITPDKIEKMVKYFKTHYYAFDFDMNFIVKTENYTQSQVEGNYTANALSCSGV